MGGADRLLMAGVRSVMKIIIHPISINTACGFTEHYTLLMAASNNRISRRDFRRLRSWE